MTISVEVLSEIYLNLKEYIPSKDRQAAADNVMSTAVDMLTDDDLKVFASTDKFLAKAAEEFLVNDEDDHYNNDDE